MNDCSTLPPGGKFPFVCREQVIRSNDLIADISHKAELGLAAIIVLQGLLLWIYVITTREFKSVDVLLLFTWVASIAYFIVRKFGIQDIEFILFVIIVASVYIFNFIQKENYYLIILTNSLLAISPIIVVVSSALEGRREVRALDEVRKRGEYRKAVVEGVGMKEIEMPFARTGGRLPADEWGVRVRAASLQGVSL